ncbi:MAG: dipicolinate synthase subunit B [Clostridiales bacterium]|nr:dipicolinate synthase subunit B [Clostridiales bacterium]
MKESLRVGFALTGSFCTFEKALRAMEATAKVYPRLLPIFSETAGATDTRFGRSADFLQAATEICGHGVIDSIRAAEPIGPKQLLDVLVIAPCTGNTLAKLAAGIADTAVTMAAKAHLRNGRPVVVAVSTNDGLAGAARNIGELLCRKHYYFVPFRQDDPVGKPTSLVADMEQIPATVTAALAGEQLQPLLLGPPSA